MNPWMNARLDVFHYEIVIQTFVHATVVLFASHVCFGIGIVKPERAGFWKRGNAELFLSTVKSFFADDCGNEPRHKFKSDDQSIDQSIDK